MKPKDDLIKKTILGMKMTDFVLSNPEVYNYIRQQTAQEIFKEIEKIIDFDGNVSLIKESLYWKIKQKYLGDKK